MDVTIQVDETLFQKFKALCETMDIAPGDYIEGIVTNVLNAVLDGITEVFSKHLPGFQQGE